MSKWFAAHSDSDSSASSSDSEDGRGGQGPAPTAFLVSYYLLIYKTLLLKDPGESMMIYYVLQFRAFCYEIN